MKIIYNGEEVEIYNGYERVALHRRDSSPYKYTLLSQHLSRKHRALKEWSPEKLIEQAAAMSEDIEHYIRNIVEVKKYPDQARKTCSGILNLAHKAGIERLSSACRLARNYSRYVFLEIQDILNSCPAQVELPEETALLPEHENIRGKDYYK